MLALTGVLASASTVDSRNDGDDEDNEGDGPDADHDDDIGAAAVPVGAKPGAAESKRRKLALPNPAAGAEAAAGTDCHTPEPEPVPEPGCKLAAPLSPLEPTAATALANALALLLKAPPKPAPPANVFVDRLTSPNGTRAAPPAAEPGSAGDALPRLPNRSRRIAADDFRPLPGVVEADVAGGPLNIASLSDNIPAAAPVDAAKNAGLFSGSMKGPGKPSDIANACSPTEPEFATATRGEGDLADEACKMSVQGGYDSLLRKPSRDHTIKCTFLPTRTLLGVRFAASDAVELLGAAEEERLLDGNSAKDTRFSASDAIFFESLNCFRLSRPRSTRALRG